jgi:hypothetical protein
VHAEQIGGLLQRQVRFPAALLGRHLDTNSAFRP